MPELDEVTIYTDGASSGNPGPGGYGVVLLCQKYRKELSGGFKTTTNNRMELLAVITGLGALKRRCRVTVVSDSKYVVNAVEKKWIEKWKRLGWRRGPKDTLLNSDLWKQLDGFLDAHDICFKWVPGHRGYRENERCDELAVAAAQQPNLPADPGFGAHPSSQSPKGMFDI
jgi:ribonuclease HI